LATQNLIGQPLDLSGQVLDRGGKTMDGVKIEIWQCDGRDIYEHPNQDSHENFDSSFAGLQSGKAPHRTATLIYANLVA